MAVHEAKWVQVPNLDTQQAGQYYCPDCKAQLIVWYNKHYIASLTGWHWKIEDGAGQEIDSMGNKQVSKYEPDNTALNEIMDEGVRRFNSLPCSRPN